MDNVMKENGKWIRYCPSCHTKLYYSQKYNANLSNKKLKKCRKCSTLGLRRSREQIENLRIGCRQRWISKPIFHNNVYINSQGIWCRKCSNCRTELSYCSKYNAISGEKSNRKCSKCNGKNYEFKQKSKQTTLENVKFNNIIQKWYRVCPMCKKHIIYEDRKIAIDGELNNHGPTLCYKCAHDKITSVPEKQFLDLLEIEDRQKYIGELLVDGLKGKTIYEFLGDYWHGNPNLYNSSSINTTTNQTFYELHDNTMKRFNKLKSMGYKIKYIWESDWNDFKKGKNITPNILDF